jgi:hypothetical protein
VDAIVVGDHDASPAHPWEGPVERGVIDIDLSPERCDEGGKEFVDSVPSHPGVGPGVAGEDVGAGLPEVGEGHHGVI